MESTQDNTPRAYWENFHWARHHSTELHEQYQDIWVAVVDQQVVAAGPSLRQVEKVAARRTGRNPEEIFVGFIGSGAAIYGLPRLSGPDGPRSPHYRLCRTAGKVPKLF